MDIVKKLNNRMRLSKGIPAVEGTANDILNALNNDKSNIEYLVQLITSDIALTQKVLKLVNSPMYISFDRNISTVSDALRVLGIKAIVHIVLGALLISKVELDEDEELAKAMLSSELAKFMSNKVSYESAAIAALLYNVGKLLASKYLSEECTKINELIDSGCSQADAENKVLGMTLQELGIKVVKDWKLPIAITSVLDNTGDPTIVNLAKFSSEASSLIYSGKEQEVENLVSTLEISEQSKEKLNIFIKQKAQTIQVKPHVERMRIKAPLEIAHFTTSGDEVDTGPTPKQQLENLLEKVKTTKFDNVQGISELVLKHIRLTYKASHCLLLKPKTFYQYTVQFGVGENMPEVSKQFVINTKETPNVIQSSIVNNVDVNICSIARLSVKSVPVFFKVLLPDVKRFIVLPINTEAGTRGLLYFDWKEEDIIDLEELALLKLLRDQFKPYCI